MLNQESYLGRFNDLWQSFISFRKTYEFLLRIYRISVNFKDSHLAEGGYSPLECDHQLSVEVGYMQWHLRGGASPISYVCEVGKKKLN